MASRIYLRKSDHVKFQYPWKCWAAVYRMFANISPVNKGKVSKKLSQQMEPKVEESREADKYFRIFSSSSKTSHRKDEVDGRVLNREELEMDRILKTPNYSSPSSHDVSSSSTTTTVSLKEPYNPKPFLQKILREQIATDLVLVAENGQEFGCHRVFLIGHSPVFEALFQKEPETTRIEMVDMNPKVVRSFLKFLYYGSTSGALENVETALELLKAAEKYGIEDLKRELNFVFKTGDPYWYTGVSAVRLFELAWNFKDCGDLKRKAVQIMAAKYDQITESEEFEQLFIKNSNVGTDICKVCLLQLRKYREAI